MLRCAEVVRNSCSYERQNPFLRKRLDFDVYCLIKHTNHHLKHLFMGKGTILRDKETETERPERTRRGRKRKACIYTETDFFTLWFSPQTPAHSQGQVKLFPGTLYQGHSHGWQVTNSEPFLLLYRLYGSWELALDAELGLKPRHSNVAAECPNQHFHCFSKLSILIA